jgi:thiol-disulfide isomerase/thioredoxin
MKERLRLSLILLAIVAIAMGYAHLLEKKGYAVPIGDPAPALRLPLLGGGEADLSAHRGKVVVVNFWATWCAPCVAEMPSLERLYKSAAPHDNIVVLTVSQDEDDKVLADFVAQNHLTLPVLRDPGGTVSSRDWRITGVPETFIVGPSGSHVQHEIGQAEWDSPEVLARLRALLTINVSGARP